MLSRWFAIGLLALTGARAVADDPPRPDRPKPPGDAPGAESAKPLADRIAAVKRDYLEREKKFYDELRAAKRDEKKIREANDRNQAENREAADKIRAMIKEGGKDPAAFDGILVLVGTLRYFLEPEETELVLRHHLANPKMGQLCFDLRYRPNEAWSERILKEVAAKHPDRAVRGQALFALGDYHRNGTRRFTHGKLTEAEEAERLAKAEQFYTEVAKDHATDPTPDGKTKLGELAAHELTRLKNIPNLKVGKVAPEIEGEDVAGARFKLSDYRGKVILLDFWGHW